MKYAGEIVYDNTGESILNVYKDLWLSENERNDMVEFGVCSENLRKLISKDDSGVTSGTTSKVSDKLTYDVHGTKQRIKVTKILEDHGFYCPYYMINNLQFITTFPKATDIMVAQSGSSVGGYTLENLEMEYESFVNHNLAMEVLRGYEAGRSLAYEHVTLMKTTEWNKDSTTVNETINLPRKSMTAIVLLFRNKNVTDSKQFVYQNIESVKITIEGIPNSVYSQGIPKSRFFEEANRLFKYNEEKNMTLCDFFKDKFALVIDLMSINDNFVH